MALPRNIKALGVVAVLAALVSACAGSGTTPAVAPAEQATLTRPHIAALLSNGDVIAINAGGAATGSFSADRDYSGSTWTYSTTNAISTTGVTNPAPQAVYQTEREGPKITYTIPGLTAGTAYTVRLSFAEIWFKAAGKRAFNVAINSTTVLTNFDQFAAAGAANTAIAESFPATASSTGTITIVLTAVTNNAAIDGIEILPSGSASPAPTNTPSPAASSTPSPAASATPTASPIPTPGPSVSGLYIHSGGAAAAPFVADEDYVASGTYSSSTTTAISTNGVSNPAPQAVYQTQRTGATISYTIPGLAPGATYNVRLDFAEHFWTSAGKRVFNIAINGTTVLSGLDIFAAAGGEYKALAEPFTATATSGGAMSIVLTATTNLAVLNGIEIVPAGGGVPSATPVPSPSPAPSSSAAITFNDYSTFGYDTQRDVFNPNSTAFTPSTLANIHLAWQAALHDYNTWTQPILATEIPGHAGVLFVGGASGNVQGFDALTGSHMWTQATGQEVYTCENGVNINFGVGGSAAYDPGSRSLYIVGNQNAAPNAVGTNTLYHLDGASGAVLGSVNVAPPIPGWPSLNFSHTSVTLANGLAYVGTGATCDISSWVGRIAAVSVPAMTLSNTFFPVWNGTTQPWGGGGVWGWGGVSTDFSGNVLSGFGNTDNGSTTHGSIVSPFQPSPAENSGYGEAFAQLSPSLSSVLAANHPIPSSQYSGTSVDLDLIGTPAVFQPKGVGCDPMAALQGKSGSIYLYDANRIGSGPVGQYELAPSTYADGFLGDPAYSPVTGLLYVNVASSNGSMYAPGMMAIDPGCDSPSVAWHAAFGPDAYAPGSVIDPGVPRSVPAPSAGGVVFVGTMCAVSGNGCGATTASANAARKPLICCVPPGGTAGGALWALDASTGTVLNGGNPLIFTSGTIRMAPTIDGNWIFVLDENGNLYGLTVDPSYPAIQAKYVPSVHPPKLIERFRLTSR